MGSQIQLDRIITQTKKNYGPPPCTIWLHNLRSWRWSTWFPTFIERFFISKGYSSPRNHIHLPRWDVFFPTSLCGVLVFDSVSRRRLRRRLRRPSLSTTIFHTHLCQPPSFTHIFVNHHLSHTIFVTHLCQPPSFTHNFVNHHLSHTIFVTHLCQPPSVTHNFVNHHLSTTIFHTHLC